jgi:uncharacterized membrane-anchored protein YhcB (DUF1043 family)
MAWTIIYFFAGVFACGVILLYVFFRLQQKKVGNQSQKQGFLEFMADKLEDPTEWKKKDEQNATTFEL